MDDNDYLEMLDAYNKWTSIGYDEFNEFSEQNKRRDAAWNAYIMVRNKYYDLVDYTPKYKNLNLH